MRERHPVSDTPSPPPRFAWDWVGWWTLVFVGNLPVPLMFGLWATSKAGVWGMVGALAVLYWIGFALCLFRFRVSRSLVWGALVLAVMQFFPLLQFLAGTAALKLTETVCGRLPDRELPATPVESELEAFVAVFLSAQPLWIIAILIGAFIRRRRGDHPIWSNRPADPDATAS